jgi:hypothetical protein
MLLASASVGNSYLYIANTKDSKNGTQRTVVTRFTRVGL